MAEDFVNGRCQTWGRGKSCGFAEERLGKPIPEIALGAKPTAVDAENVEFRSAAVVHLPVAKGAADIIKSNRVINRK